MSNIKNILLALCIGAVSAIIYDTIFPEYKYYSDADNKKDITKEDYLEKVKNSYIGEYYKKKQINLNAFLLGTVITIAMLVVDPLKRKV